MARGVEDILAGFKKTPGTQTDYDYEAWLRKTEKEGKAIARSDTANTLAMAAIGGGLAFWAYLSIAHAVLFFFLGCSISAVASRVTGQMRADRIASEHDRHLDRLYPDTVK